MEGNTSLRLRRARLVHDSLAHLLFKVYQSRKIVRETYWSSKGYKKIFYLRKTRKKNEKLR